MPQPTTPTAAVAELPPLAEAMTAQAISAHAKALAATLGSKAEIVASVSSDRHGAGVSVYPSGLLGREHKLFLAPDWPSAFARATAWAATHRTVARDNLIRRLALDVIDLTDQHGRCTAALLRGRGHSGADIAALSDAACQRASEMAASGPFVVEGV